MNGAWRTLSVVLTANTAGFISGMGRAGGAAKAFGAAVAVSLVLALGQAIAFESAMAGVAKTVDASAREMAVLERGIVSMANRMPATREEIAGVAEAAGQLGISKDYLLDFTEVAVNLGVTTNLAAADAATGLAKIANVMGTSEEDFDRLGSTLVELGNNGASTEADILSMAQRLAGVGNLVGASEADVLALANAMSSVGIEAELGGGATQRVFQIIYEAVKDGGTRLTGFAALAGESASSFAAAWEKDPVRAYQALIKGLSEVEAQGGSVSSTLDALGIKGTYNRQVILRLMGAHEVLAQSIDDGRRAWMENTALTDEAEKRYKTLESQLKTFRNQITYVGAALGGELIPYVGSGIRAIQTFGSHLQDVGGALRDVWSSVTTGGADDAIAQLEALGGIGPVMARLVPVMGSVYNVGVDLVDIFGQAYDVAKPLAESLAALGGGAIIGGLTLVATGLEGVSGFLARNEILIQAVMAATTGWAALQAWGLITTAFRAIEVRAWATAAAVTQSGVATSLGQVARGIGQIATGVPILGSNLGRLTVGLRNVGTGLAGFLSTSTGATLAIGGLALILGHLWSESRKTEIVVRGLAEAIDEIAQAGENVEDAFKRKLALSLAGLTGGIKSVGVELDAALSGMGMTAEELFSALEASGGEFTAEIYELASALDAVRPGAGGQVLDLVYAWGEAEAQAGTLAERQRDLGIATDETGEAAEKGTAAQRALAEATGRTVEDIIAEDEALAELSDSMRKTWASMFDLGGEFSGRQTLREIDAGIADLSVGIGLSVQDVRDELAEATADISANLDDTLADIDKSIAKTDRDIGRSLTKSMVGIDKDLARTVEDIQEDMAKARSELSGEELAEALARGEERIAEATEDAAERRAEAEESAAERRADAEEEAREREAEAIEEAEERRAQAVEESARRETEARERGMESINEYWAQNGVTGQQIQDFYADQTIKATEFGDNIAKAFELGYDPSLISDLLQQGPDEAAPIVEALVDDHSATLLWTVNAGVEAMKTLSDEAIEIARVTNKATGDLSDEQAAALDEAIEIGRWKATLGTRATAKAIADAMGVGVDRILDVALWYEIGLVESVNPILEALGQPRIVGRGETGVRTPGGGFAFNAGGRIPGPNVNRDIVPALLTPDEHVITQAKARLWGHDFFDAINSGRIQPGDIMAAGYNQGGQVLLAAGKRLEQAGARITEHPAWDPVDPVHVRNSHHYRNTSGTGADAFDANFGAGTSQREMAFFDHWAPIIAGMGLRVLWRVAGHYNHLHADLGGPGYGMGGSGNYSGGGFAGGHFAPLPAPPDMGDYLLANVGDMVLKKAYDAATWWAASQYAPTAVAPASGPLEAGSIKALVQQLAADKYGWTGPQWDALHELVMRESSWNPLADNPTSTAFGLFQFLDSTWRDYGFAKTSDPYQQAVAGLHYVAERYGNPAAALAFHDRNNWYNLGGRVMPYGSYDAGGYLPQGLSIAHNGTGRPEPVGHHLAAEANRALQVQVHATVINQVYVGNEYLGTFVNDRAESVVEQAYEAEARMTRAGAVHA